MKTRNSKQSQLPTAPADYFPSDVLINRNWKELGWPSKKVKAYQVYAFPTWNIKTSKKK
tara:strand:+ start:119 stop:295 length:177 start_codon:yes stop_codon:yes gene_type:complete